MKPIRLFAYTVAATQTGAATQPPGGSVPITAEVASLLEEAARKAHLHEQTRVDFDLDTTTRTNDCRDLVIALSFANEQSAVIAADGLATRLASAMDKRSSPCLLVAAGFEAEGGGRRAILWTFPRENALQFSSGRKGPSVEVLRDVFSQTSHLRKAALFEGQQLKGDFLSGRVLDLQAKDATREVADFWIRKFLQCKLSISSESGTRLLAHAFRRAHESCQDNAEQEQLYAAMMAVRTAPKKRWSLEDVADTFLQGKVKATFLRTGTSPDAVRSTFTFSVETFDDTVHFRAFFLESGVRVFAPFGEIEKSVRIEGEKKRKLVCQGTIVEEKLRSQNG